MYAYKNKSNNIKQRKKRHSYHKALVLSFMPYNLHCYIFAASSAEKRTGPKRFLGNTPFVLFGFVLIDDIKHYTYVIDSDKIDNSKFKH